MRIATFNLESLDLPPKAQVSLEERAALLRPQLARLDADILCLQEINGQHRKGSALRTLDALDGLLAGTRYAAYARATTTGPGGQGVADVHNLVTLSRWPIVEQREIRNTVIRPLNYRILSASPSGESETPIEFERPILLCEVRVGPELSLTVINVHFRAPLASAILGQKEAPFVWKTVAGWAEGYFLSAWKRTAQALEARLTVDQILDGDGGKAIIVIGDFNAEDHETPIKILAGAEEDTGNGRLAVRSLVILDRSLAADRRFSTLYHGRAQMLDHILVTRPLLAHFCSIESHNETLADEIVAFGKTRHAGQSYHAPLAAEFSFD